MFQASKRRSSISDNVLVASIDFGTTYSGWAYSFYNDFKIQPTKKFFVKQWGSGTGVTTEKTPTVVLIKPDGKTLDSFGYEAENRYRKLSESNEHKKYYYFKKFKMMLHTSLTQKITRNLLINDAMGKPLPALDVFSLAIKYFVDDFYEIARTQDVIIKQSDVRWMLTVPAIWTDQAKQFMREAAEKAGIERTKLSIVLEPEAASVYCRYLPLDKTEGRTDVSISALPIGTKYMILDAGGGTIDITVHEVTTENSVKEVVAATGGGWGGTQVDKAFKDLITDLVNKDVYKEFKEKHTEDWLNLMRNFETKKKTVHPVTEGRIMMKLPVSLLRMSERKNGCDLASYIRQCGVYASDVEISFDKVRFKTSLYRRLFQKSCLEITKHVARIIQENNLVDLNLILMVGGYSESLVLQHAVSEAFPKMKMVIPTEACTAILKGALICGHRPDFIKERVLKFTYGKRTTIRFIKGKHSEHRRIITDIGILCDKVFDKHVEKGTVVRYGEAQRKQTYYPVYLSQKCISVEIYASSLNNPEYVDVGCERIGSFNVDVIQGDLNCGVQVSFTFSGTEIQVEAAVEQTGEKKNISIDFLSREL